MRSVKVDWRIQVAYYQKFLFTVVCVFLSAVLLAVSFVFETFKVTDGSEVFGILYNVFKPLTSAIFVFMAIYSIFKLSFKRKIQHYFLFSFILLCFAGDILINFSFLGGMILFFVAHIFYVAASLFIIKLPNKSLLKKIPYIAFAYAAVLLIVNLLFGLGVFEKNVLYWVASNFYGLILVTSLFLSVYLYIDKQSLFAMYQMIAIILFLVSDTLLMFNHFLIDTYRSEALTIALNFFILVTYYISMDISAVNLKKITY